MKRDSGFIYIILSIFTSTIGVSQLVALLNNTYFFEGKFSFNFDIVINFIVVLAILIISYKFAKRGMYLLKDRKNI